MQPLLYPLALMLAQPPQEPDPAIVTPGLIGLAITMALGVAIFFLYKSMNRQLNKVDIPPAEAGASDGDGEDEQPATP